MQDGTNQMWHRGWGISTLQRSFHSKKKAHLSIKVTFFLMLLILIYHDKIVAYRKS